MGAEPWIGKMGNQVSHNLKHVLNLEHLSKRKTAKKSEHTQIIGILSFEVANIMSKIMHLHKSLTDPEIRILKNEIMKSEGVIKLVSSNESYLLKLAVAEKLEELNRVACVVSRLGKKCSEPILQGFEHVYTDIVNGVIDIRRLGYLVKDMERIVKKMERYVNATLNLYRGMVVLTELEQTNKKFQVNQHETSRRVPEQKLMWQKQDVRHLKDASFWNQTYDKVVELLARTVFTLFARICLVFGEYEQTRGCLGFSESCFGVMRDDFTQALSHIDEEGGEHSFSGFSKLTFNKNGVYRSGPVERVMLEMRETGIKPQLDLRSNYVGLFREEEFMFPCAVSPGRLFMECLNLSNSASKLDDDEVINQEGRISQASGYSSVGNGLITKHLSYSGLYDGYQINSPFSCHHKQFISRQQKRSKCGPKIATLHAPLNTVGGSALAFHYANVIIVIEKLLRYPHLVGEEARDDLYQMLPTSLRMSLRSNLKSYAKNLTIYDAPLAHDWKETVDGILRWLAPLAHNMIRWQNNRDFEQHQIVTQTNVLLLQTLYFTDRENTEAVICQLLVGMNYLCRYEHQQNALLDCRNSFDFEERMEWNTQSSYLN